MKCLICNDDKEYKLLGRHLMYAHPEITYEEYYLKFIGPKGQCSICRSPTSFLGLTNGYADTCSLSCAGRSQVLHTESMARKSQISRDVMSKNWQDAGWREKMRPVSQENIKVAQASCDYQLIGDIARRNWASGVYDHCKYGAYSKKGWYQGKYFRSTFELRAMILVHENGGKFSSEPCRILCPGTENKYGTPRVYIPDLLVELDGRTLIVEVKPEHEAEEFLASYKVPAVLAYCESQGYDFELWTNERGLLKMWWESDKNLEHYHSEVTLDACSW